MNDHVARLMTDDFFLTPKELAARRRCSESTLANARALLRGTPYIKTPTGSVLYRASDVLREEIAGAVGVNAPGVLDAIDSFPGLSDKVRTELKQHLLKGTRG